MIGDGLCCGELRDGDVCDVSLCCDCVFGDGINDGYVCVEMWFAVCVAVNVNVVVMCVVIYAVVMYIVVV